MGIQDLLTAAEADEVRALARLAGEADGVDPLSEHVILHLDAPASHLLLRSVDQGSGPALVGYAYADDEVAELCVHPQHRHRGLGRSLLESLLATGRPFGLWAHGVHPSANALALALGLTPTRELWRLRRPLTTPVPEPALPDGVTLRAFRPGEDDAAWLALNARAFAQLPDQGGWSATDLALRMAEPWFDPAGFLLAVGPGGELLGFHWTKVHPGGMGEVYVLGVDPGAPRAGLGTALTLAGLGHLQRAGIDRVLLYVDAANAPAIRLYTKLGFARWSTDTCFTGTPPRTAPAGS